MRRFEPHPLVRNPHLMTLAAHFWPRQLAGLPRAVPRLFEVEPGSRILAQCHWQSPPERHPTLTLVHGLEGSSDSAYMLGTARLALARGFNVLRLNQRNCGGTEDLTPTLYNWASRGTAALFSRNWSSATHCRRFSSQVIPWAAISS